MEKPGGEQVVTVPDVQIKPVVVEKAEPVVLNNDVDLKETSLNTKLDV